MVPIIKQPLETQTVLKNAGLGLIASLFANLSLYAIGDAMGVFDNAINPIKNKPIGFSDVIGDTIGYLLIGTIIFLLLLHFRENFEQNFKFLAFGAGILSLFQPFLIEDPEIKAIFFLESMHIISTTIFVYFMSFRMK